MKTRHLVETAYSVLSHNYDLQSKGVLTEAQAQDAAMSTIKALRYEENEYFWINDLSAKVLMHPIKPELDGKDASEIKDPNGKRIFVEFANVAKKEGAGFVYYLWPKPGFSDPVDKLSYVKGFVAWGWVIGSGIYLDDIDVIFWSSIKWLMVIFVVLAVVVFVFLQMISRSITNPINLMHRILSEVERTGDYSKKVDYQSEDEVGQAAAAFNSMMQALQGALSNTNSVMGAVAAGDFSRRVTVDARGDLAQLKQSVNDSVDKLQFTMIALTDVMNALVEGDFDKRIEAEVEGEFRHAVNAAMQAMHSMLGDVGHVMNGVAHGNLTGRVSVEGRGDLAKLKESINTSLQELSGVLKTINHNTQQVAVAASQSSTAIGQISDGAQNQMHAIDQVATAVRQTASSVEEVSHNTEAASLKAQESVTIIRDGQLKMRHMVDVVNSIALNSEKINKISEVIEGIANKTNLLSLNAAIEAARAGEHGKGFAVVAEEVGKLAANSASSTHEITRLIQQAVADASRAVAVVREVASDMERIEAGSVETNGMMQRISATLEQQSAAVHEINANVTSLSKIGQSNATASEEITATVVELAKLAGNTRHEVCKFTV